MIKLIVLYNLQPIVDEDKFLEWRLTTHQENNMAVPGVIQSDFVRIDQEWPKGAEPPYRFMTTAVWPDKDSFEKAFYDSAYQESLQENLKMLKDPVFLISEILTHEMKEAAT
jgi:hypothetical protein